MIRAFYKSISASVLQVGLRAATSQALALTLGLATGLALCSCSTASAQVITGDITGQVTDATGAAIPNATVEIVNSGTGTRRSVITDGSGEFTATQLALGTYSATISAPGFQQTAVTNIALSAGDRLRISPKLAVGGSNQTVEVNAGTSGVLQTDSSTVSSTIDQKTTQDIPLNGRNFVNLVTIQPGVNAGAPNSVSSGTRPDDRRQSGSVSANGQMELLNNFTLDGLDVNDRFQGLIAIRPSIDAIQEINVNTNLYNAEVGRTAGSVVTILTKAGTNRIHGTVYEYFRNDITDARGYFATPAAVPHKPELRQNQYGASISGPIRKDKTFFFGDYEAFRQIDSAGSIFTSTVPTLFEQTNIGNFSDQGGPVLTGAQLNATAVNYYKLFPAPTSSALVNNYVSTPARRQTQQTFDVRVDHQFNANNQFFSRYSFNDVFTVTPGPLPAKNGVQPNGLYAGSFPGNTAERAHNGQLNYTHIFSNAMLMVLRAGYTRLGIQSTPPNYGTNYNDSGPYQVTGANSCLNCSGLAPMRVTGYAILGDSGFNPILIHENTFEYGGTLSYVKGAHTLKGGVTFIRRQASDFQPQGQNKGSFAFNLGTTNFPTYTTTATANVLNLASFLQGGSYRFTRVAPLVSPSFRTSEPSFFLQDDWHATSRLTLNLGVRYEIFTQPTEKHGNISNLNLATGTLIIGGQGGLSTKYYDVSPRLGFALSLTPKSVIRGGFGLSFYPTDTQAAILFGNPPLSANSGTIVLSNLSAGVPLPVVPSTTALAGGLNYKALNYREGYNEQYNLLFQQEFGKTVATIGYVGEVGRHGLQNVPNLDLPAPSPSNTATTPGPYASVLPNVNTITAFIPGASSSYNSLQTSIQRRLSRGLTANVNYTWAHGLDDAQDGGIGGNAAAYGLLPGQIGTYDYGNADLDIRHRFAGSASYTFPKVSTSNKFASLAANGWQMNLLGFWQTGLPFTVTSSVPRINLGSTVSADRPNMVANPNAGKNGNGITHYFDLTAFQSQALGTPGNERRNQLYGPRLRRLDLSAFKTFPLFHETSLQLRAEGFNITNTANFAQPNSTLAVNTGAAGAVLTSGGFGTITSTAIGLNQRQFQFVAKIIF